MSSAGALVTKFNPSLSNVNSTSLTGGPDCVASSPCVTTVIVTSFASGALICVTPALDSETVPTSMPVTVTSNRSSTGPNVDCVNTTALLSPVDAIQPSSSSKALNAVTI